MWFFTRHRSKAADDRITMQVCATRQRTKNLFGPSNALESFFAVPLFVDRHYCMNLLRSFTHRRVRKTSMFHGNSLESLIGHFMTFIRKRMKKESIGAENAPRVMSLD